MSEAKITKKDTEHLKKLARVEFGDAETNELALDLERILHYVETLKEVDVSNVPESLYGSSLKNIFRHDEKPQEFNEALLSRLISAFPEKAPMHLGIGAPTTHRGVGETIYLKVKAVLNKK